MAQESLEEQILIALSHKGYMVAVDLFNPQYIAVRSNTKRIKCRANSILELGVKVLNIKIPATNESRSN